MSDQEIELKLQARPEDLDRLKAAPLFLKAAGRPVTRTLESTYFDTPDLRLHNRALSLRVRRQGRRFIQTLKSAPAGDGLGALVRGEWEAPVPGANPDLSLVADPSPLGEVGPLAEADLKPVFASHVRRTVRTLTVPLGNGAGGAATEVAVEVAFDQGEIRTPEGQVLPVAEVELELKGGVDPKPLYELALALNAVAPLRLETRSKSDRGYALAAGLAARPAKAGRLVIAPTDTVEQALAAIVRHCLEHLLANEAVALTADDPVGIHQMRVALRRLRSALVLFRDLIPPQQLADLGPEVKWLADSLGAARDWDVFLAELFAPVDAAFPGDPALAALGAAARVERRRGYDAALAAIASPRYTALLLRLGAWVEGRGWRDQPVSETSAELFKPIPALAGRLLDKRHRQARRRGRHFAGLEPAARHSLRISLKKLRYAVEFFRGLYDPKPVKRYLDQLTTMQGALGHLQDVATIANLVETVRTNAGADAPEGWRQGAGMVLGWHGRGLVAQEPRLLRDWDAFAQAKPFWSVAAPLGYAA